MSDSTQSQEKHEPADARDLKIAEQAILIKQLEDRIKQFEENQAQLEEKIKRLEILLSSKVDVVSSKAPVFSENYSLDRNKYNQISSTDTASKRSTGRKTSESKSHLIADTIVVFAEGVAPGQCVHHRFQNAWRIIEGKAVYVRYDIRDLPDSTDLPLPPGLRTSRSEFGMEIILISAYLHFWIGVSLDNTISIMSFFTGLELSKSQADSLLNQLASDWEHQHDTIAELIALQTILYIDETGWKVGSKSCYTWIFSTSMHVLFRCGVSRKKSEVTDVLGDTFAGIGVTDDYAVYRELFSEHQLCWAHLIRKAIKLMLQNPDEPQYVEFLDSLCSIYHDAKQLRDGVADSVSGDPLNDSAQRQAVIQKLKIASRNFAIVARKQSSLPKGPPSSVRWSSRPPYPRRRLYFFSENWLTTWIVCSFLLTIPKSNRPTIEVNAMPAGKRKFVKEPEQAKRIREQRDAALS